MSKNLDIIIADSSGNITIMVLTPVERNEYKNVAQQLLDMEELGGEQVAFVLSAPADTDAGQPIVPSMEMCGLEFCGNASRAFAFYEVIRKALILPVLTFAVIGSVTEEAAGHSNFQPCFNCRGIKSIHSAIGKTNQTHTVPVNIVLNLKIIKTPLQAVYLQCRD